MMQAAMLFEQELEKAGLNEGISKEKMATVERMLSRNYPIQEMMKIADLPESKILEIINALNKKK